MLTQLFLSGFKSVDQPIQVDFRDITLLYGENSAGKSTILQALQYAREVLLKGNLDALRTELGGDVVDLGGFRKFVHGRDRRRAVEIGISTSVGDFTDNIDIRQFYEFASQSQTHPSLENSLRSFYSQGPLDAADAPIGLGKFNVGKRPDSLRVKVQIREAPETQKVYVAKIVVEFDGAWLLSLGLNSHMRPDDVTSGQTGSHSILINLNHPVLPEAAPDLGKWCDHCNSGGRAFLLDTDQQQVEQNEREDHAFWQNLIDAEKTPEGSWGWRERLKELAGANELAWAFSSRDRLESLLELDKEVPFLTIQDGVLWELPYSSSDETDYVAMFGRMPTNQEKRDLSVPTIYATAFSILAFKTVQKELSRLHYIGPLRRHYSAPTDHRAIGDARGWADGLGAWDALANSPTTTFDTVNHWLSKEELFGFDCTLESASALTRQVEHELADADTDAAKRLAALLTHLRIADRILITTADGVYLNTTELGIGFSQIVPIVVAARGPQSGCFLLEQPELHIHARLQAVLGDLLATGMEGGASTYNGRQFIVETHSEFLLLRLMRRIRETTKEILGDGPRLLCDNVAVYHVHKQDGQTAIQKLPLDTYGNLTEDWPDDLFDLSFKERFGE